MPSNQSTREAIDAYCDRHNLMDEDAEYFKNLFDSALKEERESKWRPIESAPKETHVLVVNQHGDIEQAWWSGIVGRWHSALGGLCEPTLWQPLPDPPTIRRDFQEEGKE